MTAGYRYCTGSTDCFAEPGEDPVKFAIEQPMMAQPGEYFQYNNGTVFPLLVEILARVTGMDALAYAKMVLGESLGISASLERMSVNNTFKPRDMAKFGYLYLKQGVWEDEQIISADWIKASTQSHNGGGKPSGAEYGYLIWVTEVQGFPAYFAGGLGGQFIYVVPDLDLVVVITSDFEKHHEENRYILIDGFIIPAILRNR